MTRLLEERPVGELSKASGEIPEQLPDPGALIPLGSWYWVTEDGETHFACVMDVGSNHVKLRTVKDKHGYSTFRIHFKDFEKQCRLEKDPVGVIRGKVAHYQEIVKDRLADIRSLTARLGLSDSQKLEQAAPGSETNRSMSVLSGTDNIKKYKTDLIQAKEKDLPKLFEEVKEAHEKVATWMSAETLPMEAMMGDMRGVVEKIEGRIFNVSLYAGLSEEVAQVKAGQPAPITEKLRIMQRMCYMDEECLVNYKHGGMTFKEIGEFDRWLKKKENLDRLMPFPRTMLAFRVRRTKKDRGPAEDLLTAYIQVKLEELDKLTFLYIRNGENLYRLNCDLEFGDLIFPGKDEFNLNEPMRAQVFAGHVNEVITERHFEDLIKEKKADIKEKAEKHKQWLKDNPDKEKWKSPFYDSWAGRDLSSLMSGYKPFNPTSVYYDDIRAEIERRVQHYNRIALIVQGLYDRSEILHPHPPVRLWNDGAFEHAVELVYADHSLYHGEAPDFEAYRKELAASLGAGSVTIGQEDFWMAKEAKRENRRWNSHRHQDLSYFRPSGNPGPGFISKITSWQPRMKKATFTWKRERQVSNYWKGHKYGDLINAHVTVPADQLFNVSAYIVGSYKRFYADPRTRARYFEWAHLLLSAEEYHAGNLKIGDEEKISE